MTLLLAGLAVTAGAVAQAVSGIGFTLVSGPLLVVLLGQSDGVRVSVALSLVLNLVVLAPEARQVRWSVLPALLVPAAVATPATALALRHVDARVAQLLAGLVTLVGAWLVARGRGWAKAGRARAAVAAGALSGAMNVTAGIGGPAVALFAQVAGWPIGQVRPTLQAYFLTLNVVALGVLGPIAVSPTLWLALGVGTVLGMALAPSVSQTAAQRVTLALAVAGGVTVLARALASF